MFGHEKKYTSIHEHKKKSHNLHTVQKVLASSIDLINHDDN